MPDEASYHQGENDDSGISEHGKNLMGWLVVSREWVDAMLDATPCGRFLIGESLLVCFYFQPLVYDAVIPVSFLVVG